MAVILLWAAVATTGANMLAAADGAPLPTGAVSWSGLVSRVDPAAAETCSLAGPGGAGRQRFLAPDFAPVSGLPGLGWIFDTSNYQPRWLCGNWSPAIGWLHICSDIAIWLAYLAIPIALVYFAWKQGELPFRGLFLLFGAFIVCCGTTHLMEAVLFWWPAYGLAGVIKLVTALISVTTVVVLAAVIPQALALRTPAELEETVRQRTRELDIARREAALIVEASPTGKIMIDEQGRIVLVNAVAERLFGYDRDELLHRPVEVLLPERFQPQHPRLRAAFFASPKVRRMGEGRDLYGLRKDGSEFPVEIGLSPIETTRGRFVLGAVIDLTERKRLEQRFQTSVEAAPTPMVMVNRHGLIVLVNRELEKLFGYHRLELLRQPIEMLIPARFRPQHPQYRDSFFAGPEPRRMGEGRDLYGLHKDGSEFPIEIGLSPIETEEGRFALGAVVDLTERKRIEADLERANLRLKHRVARRTSELTELHGRNEELEQFAYIASHDLQEPLRKIASCCQALAEDYADKLDEDGREWISFAVDGATRMRQLVSDLLEFSRIGTHGQTAEPTDAVQACKLAIDNLDDAIQEREAEVICRPLPTVLADASQLVQLFQNLIGNSIKYCTEERPVVEIGAEPDGGQWQFYVKDNGIGIAPEYHERIFQIFQRLHRKDEYEGTGIGLAICKKVVERMGGELWVESQAGQGSTFYFTLRAADSLHEGAPDDDAIQQA
ncbi:MAG: PAS domain S-box protein [Planctomycetaceae bacterium]